MHDDISFEAEDIWVENARELEAVVAREKRDGRIVIDVELVDGCEEPKPASSPVEDAFNSPLEQKVRAQLAKRSPTIELSYQKVLRILLAETAIKGYGGTDYACLCFINPETGAFEAYHVDKSLIPSTDETRHELRPEVTDRNGQMLILMEWDFPEESATPFTEEE